MLVMNGFAAIQAADITRNALMNVTVPNSPFTKAAEMLIGSLIVFNILLYLVLFVSVLARFKRDGRNPVYLFMALLEASLSLPVSSWL
jgi:hypothetical protein